MTIPQSSDRLTGRQKLYFIFKYGVLFAFVLCALVLIVESLIPGKLSGQHSSEVGDIVDLPVNKVIEPTDIRLRVAEENVSDEVWVGQSVTLVPYYEPRTTSFKHTLWSISDETVAVIEGDTATFKAAGVVTITAISDYDHSLTDSITFDVKEVMPQKIVIEQPELPLTVGMSIFPKVSVLPENVTHGDYILLSDSDCIRVDGEKLIAEKAGEATITAVSSVDYTVFRRMTMSVVLIPAQNVRLISADDGNTVSDARLQVGERLELCLDILPIDATKQRVDWQASDGLAVYFSSTNRLTVRAIAPGTQSLTVSLAREGLSATVSIEVEGEADRRPIVGLTVDDLLLNVGEGSSPSVKSVASDGSELYGRYVVSIDRPDIAEVNDLGLITALNNGSATITVRLVGSDLSARATVTVTDVGIRYLFISTPDHGPAIGKPYRLTAEFLPRNATATDVVWSVDKDIAEIKFGVVQFFAAGTVTVTATAQSGATATITLTAENVLEVSDIRAIGFESFETKDGVRKAVLKKNESARLSIIFSPAATYRKATITSSDPDTVDATKRTVTGLKSGTATLTINYWDGNENIRPIIFTIEVTVVEQRLSDFVENWGYVIRKGIGHFGAFLLTGIFAALTFMLFLRNKPLGAILTMLSGFGLAGLTELLQMITPGRGPSFSDVMLDFQGFCFSAIVVLAVFLIRFIVKAVKRKKSLSRQDK